LHNTAQGVEHRLRSEVLGWYEVDEVFLAVCLLKSKATVRGGLSAIELVRVGDGALFVLFRKQLDLLLRGSPRGAV